ncbi:hypothetical protein J5N97_023896 [Dioscorea zingiberensis]|uniref:Uncharacterized protein n=1 Tax=Dioscorea zingiberensis TaxID=325984 RepID=A0A9D5H896_9LILI|nr:hypothetical protein J5N97_023896 [Dioscorea zingiberensis]
MELLNMGTKLSLSLLLCLSISSLLPPLSTATPSGTIHRTTTQQVLASISGDADDQHSNSQPFLTSLSGKYTACLLRASSSATGTEGSPSVTLELVDDGDLRIFNEDVVMAWEATNEPLATQGCASTLETPSLVPETDPFIVSPPPPELVPVLAPPPPELAPVLDTPPPELVPVLAPPPPELAPVLAPPVSSPVVAPSSPGLLPGSGSPLTPASNGGSGLPFGKPVPGGGLSSVNQPVGLGGGQGQGQGQPLVDNTPYDSGSWIGRDNYWFGVGLALLLHVLFLAHGFLF